MRIFISSKATMVPGLSMVELGVWHFEGFFFSSFSSFAGLLFNPFFFSLPVYFSSSSFFFQPKAQIAMLRSNFCLKLSDIGVSHTWLASICSTQRLRQFIISDRLLFAHGFMTSICRYLQSILVQSCSIITFQAPHPPPSLRIYPLRIIYNITT